MGGRKDGWCEPPHPFEPGGSISVIPRPGAAFYTRGDSSLASSSTTGTGPRGIEMPSPCRVRRRRMCALGGREGGRSKPINLSNHIHHSRSRSKRTVTVVGASRQIRLSGAEATRVYGPPKLDVTIVEASNGFARRSLHHLRHAQKLALSAPAQSSCSDSRSPKRPVAYQAILM